jgi:hypothetical protein
MEDDLIKFRQTCDERFHAIFNIAFGQDALNCIFTLVRVSGMSGPGWDPFEESFEAFQDYEKMNTWSAAQGNLKLEYRIQMLYYCHLIEAAAPLEMIANLFRCTSNKGFVVRPFPYGRRKKEDPIPTLPPSLMSKISVLQDLEKKAKIKICDLLNLVINDGLRNSFFHSDYCLTDKEYRWTRNGPGKIVPLAELDSTLKRAFAFYSSFFSTWRLCRAQLAQGKRVHQLPNFDTLELLNDEDGLLSGFQVHFSNNTIAKFNRTKNGVEASNFSFGKDGSVSFFVGNKSSLKKEWVYNGIGVKNFADLP